MNTSISSKEAIESLCHQAGLIRTAAKVINQFLDETDAKNIGDSSLNAFDAMQMADMILKQARAMEHAIGVLELHERSQQDEGKEGAA